MYLLLFNLFNKIYSQGYLPVIFNRQTNKEQQVQKMVVFNIINTTVYKLGYTEYLPYDD